MFIEMLVMVFSCGVRLSSLVFRCRLVLSRLWVLGRVLCRWVRLLWLGFLIRSILICLCRCFIRGVERCL